AGRISREAIPTAASEFRIMVCTVHLPPDQPPDRPSHDHIRGKMLLAENAACADRRGQAVRRKLSEWAGIFVSDDAGDGPGHSRMVGWKRITAPEKFARALSWPLASK